MTIDLIIEIFEINGLLYVALAALTAGIDRGFSGFGTAMIFLPVAGKYFEPVMAIIILTIMDLCGPALIVPRALRDAYKPDLFRLIGGMILTLPIALYFLLNMETELFRYIVSILALILVFVLATGWRFEGQLHSSALIGLGGIAGVNDMTITVTNIDYLTGEITAISASGSPVSGESIAFYPAVSLSSTTAAAINASVQPILEKYLRKLENELSVSYTHLTLPTKA